MHLNSSTSQWAWFSDEVDNEFLVCFYFILLLLFISPVYFSVFCLLVCMFVNHGPHLSFEEMLPLSPCGLEMLMSTVWPLRPLGWAPAWA